MGGPCGHCASVGLKRAWPISQGPISSQLFQPPAGAANQRPLELTPLAAVMRGSRVWETAKAASANMPVAPTLLCAATSLGSTHASARARHARRTRFAISHRLPAVTGDLTGTATGKETEGGMEGEEESEPERAGTEWNDRVARHRG